MPPAPSRVPAIWRPSGPITWPSALTATSATQTRSPQRLPAMPKPVFIAPSPPSIFPTLAPVPAPTLPSASAWPAPSRSAASAAARPIALSGCALSPTSRSNRHAPVTIGTCAPASSNPMPRSDSASITPQDASRPKALPPDRMTACTSCTMFSGLRRSVSRVAGPPPRTSTPHTAPSGATITVQPVPAAASWACAQRNAGMSANAAVSSMGPSSDRPTRPFYSTEPPRRSVRRASAAFSTGIRRRFPAHSDRFAVQEKLRRI